MPAKVLRLIDSGQRRRYWTKQSRKKSLYLKQSRIPGGRMQCGAGLEPIVESAVIHTMEKFHISRPMLISLALAHFLSVDIDDAAKTNIRPVKK